MHEKLDMLFSFLKAHTKSICLSGIKGTKSCAKLIWTPWKVRSKQTYSNLLSVFWKETSCPLVHWYCIPWSRLSCCWLGCLGWLTGGLYHLCTSCWTYCSLQGKRKCIDVCNAIGESLFVKAGAAKNPAKKISRSCKCTTYDLTSFRKNECWE